MKVFMLNFDSLYALEANYLYQICYRLQGETENAERLFVKVWKSLHGPDDEPSGSDQEVLTNFSNRVLLCRLLAQAHRRLGHALRKLDRPRSPQPWEFALARLAPEYRLPLVFKEVGGLNYGEISMALEIPEATVRSRLARARAMVRDVLKGQETA